MQLDLSSLAKKLLIGGLIGIALCIVLWSSSRPPAPSAFQHRQASGSLIAGFGVSAAQEAHDTYHQCFTASTTRYATCPLGGNLHIAFWFSVLLAAVSGVMLTSLKPVPLPHDAATPHSTLPIAPQRPRANPEATRLRVAVGAIVVVQAIIGFIGSAILTATILFPLGYYNDRSIVAMFLTGLLACTIIPAIGYGASRFIPGIAPPGRPNIYGTLALAFAAIALFMFASVRSPHPAYFIVAAATAGYWLGPRLFKLRAS